MKIGGFFIALVFALAACSGDPQPREPEPTTAPTPSSTATPPTMPAQAREDSTEGAAAFVDYWVQVSNYAAATGDVTELSRISSPDCSGCQKYIDLYRDTYEAGGYFRGGEWTIGEFQIREDESQTLLSTDLDFAESSFKLSANDEESNGDGEQVAITFGLDAAADERQLRQLFLGGVE